MHDSSLDGSNRHEPVCSHFHLHNRQTGASVFEFPEVILSALLRGRSWSGVLGTVDDEARFESPHFTEYL